MQLELNLLGTLALVGMALFFQWSVLLPLLPFAGALHVVESFAVAILAAVPLLAVSLLLLLLLLLSCLSSH